MIITIPGRPIPKARPRVFKNRTITPKRTKDYEARIASAVRAAWSGKPIPKDTGVVVCIDFHFKRPQRLNRKKDPQLPIPKTSRPDIDNLAKSILDGITQAGVWHDDGQVQSLIARKWYTGKPSANMGRERIVIRIDVCES